ncbi:MAG: hypothetical protein QOF51_1112 [Chloroflexota bacterium]|nr:hypothetical protein [Chloroflexota bacterium]
MTYGAKESNSKEGSGLALFIVGLVLVTAGWAYAPAALQIILVLLGIAAAVGGVMVMRMAKSVV